VGCAHFGGDATDPAADQAQGTEPAPATAVPDPSTIPDTPLYRSEAGAAAVLVEEAPFESVTTNGQAQIRTTTGEEKQAHEILDEALGYCELAQGFWQTGELEKALEALDMGYALILGIDDRENPDILQQKEDLRFLISKRILEIYASRTIVVNGKHDAIPLDMNSHVQREIKSFTVGHEKKFFKAAYARSGRYRPMIIAKLQEAGLPEELSWLPLIESGYKVNALSKARALGMWQFIPSTGYKFGLKRNKYIDERLDPVKSTDAAIAYMKEMHQMFGDWATVLAGYNCGEGRVAHVIRTQNINYLDNFWDLYQRLPRETARYVPRYLATLHIVRDPAKYGLDQVTLEPPMVFDTVKMPGHRHLSHVAKAINTTEKELKGLNPELRYNITPDDNYPLRVPPDKATILQAKISTIPKSTPPRPAYVHHRIRKGETLSTIARRYGTSVGRIARANNLRSNSRIYAGKKLKIPQKGKVVYTVQSSKTAPVTAGQATTHVVRKGDSLWNIARRYGTTTKKIQRHNNLKSTQLYVNQVLRIPGGKASKPVVTSNLKKYQVKRGDNPYSIASLHNMSLKRFLRINSLTPRSRIYPGQNLYVE
jgi:membrane-bound lytic murein transglycosylase D